MNYAAVDQAIRSGLADRTVPTLCRLALAEIAEGRRELRAVRHPLGFLCLPVYRDRTHGVCVHVWSPAVPHAQATTSSVHSHSWDLVSFVLYGRVGNTLCIVDDAVDGTQRIFEVHSHGDVDEIRATPRRVRCVPAQHRVVDQGKVYRLLAGRFHASTLEGERQVATVVLGRAQAARDLSLGALDTPTHRVVRQRCDFGETASVAQLVVAELVIRGMG